MSADDRSDEGHFEGVDNSLLQFVRAHRAGMAVPAIVVKRALGKHWQRFHAEPAICVVLIVRSPTWVSPVMQACAKLAKWHHVIEGDFKTRIDTKAASEMAGRLAGGDRVLCVYPANVPLPEFLAIAADLVVEILDVEPSDISKSIRMVTGRRLRGVASIPHDLDLVKAMSSIRKGSTPSACLRRILTPATKPPVDQLVLDAPYLEELHGYGDAMSWARRLVSDLDRWRAGELDMASIQRNAVLAGPPGTGKSTFVRSLAKSTGLPLVTSSIGKMFGTSAGYLDSIVKSIDALFATAHQAGPSCIVFIDELEGFPDRSGLDGRHASWWTPVVNHMLTTLDDALSGAAGGLIVIGATNHPGRLDPALTRPGRMDRIINVGLPDEKDLPGIFRQHLGSDLEGQSLAALGVISVGSTGADVAGHVKGARARARHEGRPIRLQDLVDEVFPRSDMSEDDLWRACVHECGHVVASRVLGTSEVVNVSVGEDGRGRAGRVQYRAASSKFADAEHYRRMVVQVLSGRAAEEILLPSVSGGAGGGIHSDLAKASTILAANRLSLGLGDTLGYVSDPAKALEVVGRHPDLLGEIEIELQELYRSALELVGSNVGPITLLAERLTVERVMSGDRVNAVLGSLEPKVEGPRNGE